MVDVGDLQLFTQIWYHLGDVYYEGDGIKIGLSLR